MGPRTSFDQEEHEESVLTRATQIRQTLPSQRAQKFGHSPQVIDTYLRIGQTFLPEMAAQLENASAPPYIWKWIAYGRHPTQRILRMALAIRLRREHKRDDRPGRSTSGYAWVRNEQTSSIELAFRGTSAGRAVYMWIGVELRGGSLSERFWTELGRRVEDATHDTGLFWALVEERMAMRVKRRSKAPVRLPTELETAMKTLGQYVELHASTEDLRKAAKETIKGNSLTTIQGQYRKGRSIDVRTNGKPGRAPARRS